jgi:hypothetical protein
MGRKTQGSPRDSRVAEISQRYGDPFFCRRSLRSKAQRTGKGEEIMSARLLKNLKYAAAYSILVSVFIVTPVQAAQTDALFLFRSPGAAIPAHGGTPRTVKLNIPLKLDEKGDLLVQCGCARFTVAYNEPADQFKPSGQQQFQQRERSSNINGISLSASLSF